MKRLILVRHGETVDNIARTIQGQRPGMLSSNGLAQVERLAERLSSETFDAVYSSDLRRVRETTDVIVKHHSLSPIFLEDLRERGFGELEGHSFDAYTDFAKASQLPFYEVKPKGGESIADLFTRGKRVLKTITTQSQKKSVLISAHGMLNKVLILLLLERDYSGWAELHQDNACVNTFEFDEHGVVTKFELNCVKHLPPIEQDTELE